MGASGAPEDRLFKVLWTVDPGQAPPAARVGGLLVPTDTIGAALCALFDAVLSPSHPGGS